MSETASTPDRLRFSYRLRVRYPETDQQGVVYHSRYLEYFDLGMTEFFRAAGWDYPNLVASGLDPSLIKTELSFHRPARFDEEIDISVRPVRVGTSSWVLAFAIVRPGEPAALTTGKTTYVNLDAAVGRARPIPGAIRAALLHRLEPEESHA